MAQTARISCIKEPLLKETIFLNNFGFDDRGDVYCDWTDNSEVIVDFVSCNVANDTLVHRRKLNPVSALDFKAKENHRKYENDIEKVNADGNTQLVFIAFPFSINGRLFSSSHLSYPLCLSLAVVLVPVALKMHHALSSPEWNHDAEFRSRPVMVQNSPNLSPLPTPLSLSSFSGKKI
ncbi:hypothetical protein P9112_008582 [Eukaryota sp. TZLM1-RC]